MSTSILQKKVRLNSFASTETNLFTTEDRKTLSGFISFINHNKEPNLMNINYG